MQYLFLAGLTFLRAFDVKPMVTNIYHYESSCYLFFQAAAVSVGKDVAKYLYQKNINPQPILKINPNAPIGSEAKRIVKHIG